MLPDVNILALEAPTGLTATPTSTSTIDLNWDEVTNATSYNIYRSLTENGAYTLITTTTDTAYTDINLIQNTTYYYRVEGINATEEGIPSAPVDATTLAIGAPTNVTITNQTANSVTITWNGVEGASGYNIYRANTATGPYSLVNTTTTITYTDTNLLPNTTYYYQITTLQNNVEGATSTPVATSTANVTIPTAPNGLTATPLNSTTIRLNWNSVLNANYYNVYRSLTPNGQFSEVGTTTTTSFLDNNLVPNTAYYYQITATNSAGTSPISNIANATTQQQSIEAPILNITTICPNSVFLNWTMVNGATSYMVLRSTTPNGTFTPIATVTNTNYLDNIETNTIYYYQIIPYTNGIALTPSNIVNTYIYPNMQPNVCRCQCCYCNYCCNNNYNRCCYRRNWWLW